MAMPSTNRLGRRVRGNVDVSGNDHRTASHINDAAAALFAKILERQDALEARQKALETSLGVDAGADTEELARDGDHVLAHFNHKVAWQINIHQPPNGMSKDDVYQEYRDLHNSAKSDTTNESDEQ